MSQTPLTAPLSPPAPARPPAPAPVVTAAPKVPFGPNVVAAVLCMVVTLAYAGSFGQLVFDGALAPYVGFGLMSALVSSVVMMLVLSWRSSFRFSIGGPDSNPSAVLAVTLGSLAHEVMEAGGAKAPELLPTVMMYVLASSIGCGLVVRLLGERGSGRYVRYIPHPVIGGFLAGTGYLLVAGAFKTLTGAKLTLESLSEITRVTPLAGVTAGVVAVLLLVLTRKVRHYLVIPSVIVGAIFVFHLLRAVLGIDVAQAQSQGLLLPSLDLSTWRNVGNISFELVRWDLILMHAKDFGAMTTVVAVAVMLNTTSIELASGHDGSADRELQAIGMGNIFAGILGGMVACNPFNRSLLNLKAGANSRWAACLCAGFTLFVMVATPGAVGYLPRPVLTGLILFLGLNLLVTWIVEAKSSLTGMDHAVVLVILGIVMWMGIVAGVVFGIFVACVTLAVTLSRSPNIRHRFTAQNRRANIERTPDELEKLRAHGGAMRGYSLQGVLFFGTAARLLDEIRGGLANTGVVLLDFRLVQGADGSSVVMLKRVQTVCREAGVRLVITGLTTRMASMLARGGVELSGANVRRFADLDRGLEWCEDFILGQNDATRSLADVLDEALTRVGSRILTQKCEYRRLAAGELLVRQGEPSNEMFFVESGRVQVLLRLEGMSIDDSKRLRSYGPGTVVGEMGFYSGESRSADIVAEKDTQVLCITREQLAEIEVAHPALARSIHRYVINILSQRLRCSNDEIRMLL